MTRDECLGAISAAYNDVFVEAVVGYWDVHITTRPARHIVLTNPFLQNNVVNGGMSPAELTAHIKGITDSSWAKYDNGTLLLVLQ